MESYRDAIDSLLLDEQSLVGSPTSLMYMMNYFRTTKERHCVPAVQKKHMADLLLKSDGKWLFL